MGNEIYMITNQGVSQAQRWLNTLAPDYVQIDSQETPDLINFIYKISSQFNYYHTQTNKIDGTWENFISNDPYLLTLLISLINVSDTIDQLQQIIKTIANEHLIFEQLKGLKTLIQFLFDLESELSKLQKQLNKLAISNHLEEILISIKNTEDDLILLRSYCEEGASEFINFENPNIYNELSELEKKNILNKNIFKGNSNKEKILNSLPHFTEIFNSIIVKYNYLVEASQSYIARNSLYENQFAPQIGLLIGFLDLYALIRNKINEINRRHLDYYYKNLLQLKQSQGHPDLVHLIIEPEANSKRLEIDSSNLLLAEIPNKENGFTYQLDSPIILSFAEIVEIKTIFMSHFTQIVSPNIQMQDLIEKQVYQASQKLFNASGYQKNSDNFASWPALGEDQHDQLGNMRTMEDSNLGLHIGSSLFYLPEGERTISILICLKKDSFYDLVRYFLNFSELKNKKIESAIHDLLSNAFTITYTSPKGWEKIKSYTVKFDINNKKDKAIELVLRLNSSESAIDSYNKDIHLLNFDSKFPLIRIGLNNYDEHHPYSFLNNSLIDRITIKTNVKGFRSLVLQNNIGLISPTSPFQIFGPQPVIGSFLDIKNTIIFNRYTKDFCLHLDWLDLPRESGGFETYYKGYGEKFANDSFAISIKTLKNGTNTINEQHQQRKPLFTLKKQSSILDSHTTINEIDFSKLEFLNQPILSSNEQADVFSNDGVLRLELCSPPEAFGQKLFPQIFPQAVMNQSKKFAKKEPLPNQPLIPIIKSIAIDYSLEYTENIDGTGNAEDSNIQLFHDYPFGYETIYPSKNKKQIQLMPVFTDYNNLCIGLKHYHPIFTI